MRSSRRRRFLLACAPLALLGVVLLATIGPASAASAVATTTPTAAPTPPRPPHLPAGQTTARPTISSPRPAARSPRRRRPARPARNRWRSIPRPTRGSPLAATGFTCHGATSPRVPRRLCSSFTGAVAQPLAPSHLLDSRNSPTSSASSPSIHRGCLSVRLAAPIRPGPPLARWTRLEVAQTTCSSSVSCWTTSSSATALTRGASTPLASRRAAR